MARRPAVAARSRVAMAGRAQCATRASSRRPFQRLVDLLVEWRKQKGWHANNSGVTCAKEWGVACTKKGAWHVPKKHQNGDLRLA